MTSISDDTRVTADDIIGRALIEAAGGFDPANWTSADWNLHSIEDDPDEYVRQMMVCAADFAGDLENMLWTAHRQQAEGHLSVYDMHADIAQMLVNLIANASTVLQQIGSEVTEHAKEWIPRLVAEPFPDDPADPAYIGTLAARMAVHSHFTFRASA